MRVTRNLELGEFLRSRRALLSPDIAGVVQDGSARRVPGLRREEVAELAMISVNYYTRIEQGETHQVSDSVIESLANALRLNETERLYLARLARPASRTRLPADHESLRESVRHLADSNGDQAVFVAGRRTDLLAANGLARALLGLRRDERPNMARLILLDPSVRRCLVDWEHEALNVTAYLRTAVTYWPDDTQLRALVGELSAKSPEFPQLWAAHPVGDCLHRTQEFRHPVVGNLTLRMESLRLPDDPDKLIVFFGASGESSSAQRLRQLRALAHPLG
jgi:transcriptional regulator with XRE-family HTH domain